MEFGEFGEFDFHSHGEALLSVDSCKLALNRDSPAIFELAYYIEH